MPAPDTIMLFALGTTIVAVLAIAAAGAIGWRVWRQFQHVRATQDVATQLVDTHASRLFESIDESSARIATAAEGGEQLAEHLAELRADVAHLQWMVQQIPQARTRLKTELLNLVLPTRDDEDDARRTREVPADA